MLRVSEKESSVTEMIYATQKVANAGGRQVRNPVHFVSPEENVKTVYVQDGYTKVRNAYAAKGVIVKDLADLPNTSPAEASASKGAAKAKE
jgi:hypothetical protein